MEIILHRMYLPTATHGLLTLNGLPICFTIELPYVGNQKQISCIPEGVYPLKNRYSARFKKHIEILNVPNRSYILFHPANNAPRELRGCIAPVTELLSVGWGSQSRLAMNKLLTVIQPFLDQQNAVLRVQEASEAIIIQLIKNRKL
ncbi:MAG: DUF5675 family protein [Flavobacteriaceae bacterium]|jgi:hypothetical protein|nr:DUF5675 family protein [Flavobacteriaceae bacterium]